MYVKCFYNRRLMVRFCVCLIKVVLAILFLSLLAEFVMFPGSCGRNSISAQALVASVPVLSRSPDLVTNPSAWVTVPGVSPASLQPRGLSNSPRSTDASWAGVGAGGSSRTPRDRKSVV